MIKLTATPFNPWEALQAYQAAATHMANSYGATSAFVGTMRDFNQGDQVSSMMLEHYPGMTEKVLDAIVSEVREQWAILDCLVIHRVGEVFPDQPIVLVAVWSTNRCAAFEACRMLMEALKSKAPFWKKEQLKDNQSRWVTENSKGY